MKTGKSIYLILFVVLSFVHLFAISADNETLSFCTKPLLISSLAIWFYISVRPILDVSSRFFLTGLVFSVVGDILLMYVKTKGEFYFILGLGSFLLAHLSYITAFYHYQEFRSGLIWQRKWLALPFVIILFALLYFLWNGLGNFKIPVAFYSAAIITMSGFCFNMGNRVQKGSFQKLFGGAVLFVLSDFIIAIKKFRYPEMNETWSSLAIMSTYLLGQFLLTNGMANSMKQRENWAKNIIK